MATSVYEKYHVISSGYVLWLWSREAEYGGAYLSNQHDVDFKDFKEGFEWLGLTPGNREWYLKRCLGFFNELGKSKLIEFRISFGMESQNITAWMGPVCEDLWMPG